MEVVFGVSACWIGRDRGLGTFRVMPSRPGGREHRDGRGDPKALALLSRGFAVFGELRHGGSQRRHRVGLLEGAAQSGQGIEGADAGAA